MTQLVACGRCRWWRSAKGRRVVSRRSGSGSGERESGQRMGNIIIFPFIQFPSASPHRKPPISRHCAPGRPNWQPDHHGIGDRGNEPTDCRTSLLARIGVVHTYHMPYLLRTLHDVYNQSSFGCKERDGSVLDMISPVCSTSRLRRFRADWPSG